MTSVYKVFIDIAFFYNSLLLFYLRTIFFIIIDFCTITVYCRGLVFLCLPNSVSTQTSVGSGSITIFDFFNKLLSYLNKDKNTSYQTHDNFI